MRTAAILPVKRFAQAKARLRASVAAELRARLAQAMVADVLQALSEVEAIERTILVTGEPSLAAGHLGPRVLLVEDRAEDGQSPAVSAGVRAALAQGCERVLCVPGDCPALKAAELEQLLAGPAPAVVIVPDRHGTGTNGLLLSPPDAIAPSFGPGSCARHQALARAAGLDFRIARPGSLLLDVDTGADLDALRAHLGKARSLGRHTRALLGHPERTPPILSISGGRG